MQVANLIKENNIFLNFNLDKCIGQGQNGQVFEVDQQRVLKLSVVFSGTQENVDTYPNFYLPSILAIKHMLNHEEKAFAKCYEFMHLGYFSRNLNKEKQNYILFYYVLEKCNPISEDEAKVFHTLLSHEDAGKKKDLSEDRVKNLVKDLSFALDFDADKVMLFVEQIRSAAVKHNDAHPRNIMKDSFGYFKFIDFDLVERKENG